MLTRSVRRCLIVCGVLITAPVSFADEAKPTQPANQDDRATESGPPAKSPQQEASPASAVVPENNKAATAPQQSGTDNKKDDWIAHLWSDLKITDILLTLFTGALAIYTYRLWRSTEKLWLAGKEQLTVSINATKEMVESNAIANNSLTIDHRAWLSIDDPQLADDMVFIDNKCTMVFSVRITNIGQTLAHFIRTNMALSPDYASLVPTFSLCRNKARSTADITATKTLLPGMNYRRSWALTIDETGKRLQISIPIIVGSTVYRIAFDDKDHHTDFVFTPGRKGKAIMYHPIPATGTTPRDQLVWESGPAGEAT
jgi:hypothetical protein